jgi:hypothetical protein
VTAAADDFEAVRRILRLAVQQAGIDTPGFAMAALRRIEDAVTMPRCQDCRWWEGKSVDLWGVCMRFSTLEPRTTPLPEGREKALIGGAFANWVTDFDFGCVQWEARG